MKHQELLHIHALLFKVSAYIKREDTSHADIFARYESQPTRPHHVHRGKDAHRTAITHLLCGCSRAIRAFHQHTQTASPGTTPS
ncbi:UPF0058 family protein [Halapricum hydrolyticum]|uniref:UPF0058 family protein n=2 Tax=Halapricum hydrolyticum TaxID=2979991 RepID=A0AAE3LEU2_9EURY|nr:UPF0058 family protein [Halapricum hydrolyticum]MCU4726510.1 UPF0058 family protein [Halapricum hydrolyticum]